MNKIDTQRKPLFYEESESGFVAFAGKKRFKLTNEQINEMRRYETTNIAIKRDPLRDSKSLEELYADFIKDADALKKETKGLVDMYKTGRDTETAKTLAYHFITKNKITAEDITMDEFRWLQAATQGALIFGEPYKGKLYRYDVNSAYPAIYSHFTFLIPVKQGEFQTLTKEKFEGFDSLPYGIYRAIVSYPNKKKKWRKLFRINDRNYYTGNEINYAKELGLDVELIEDDEPNLLHYPRKNCKTGQQVFREFVNLIYPLREKPEIKHRCKSFLRSLWGALCHENTQNIVYEQDEDVEIYDSKEILADKPHGETTRIMTLLVKNRPYTSNFARMKPFLLAKARIRISRQIAPHVAHVHRCHTDSMDSSIELPIECSMELGQMKLTEIIENAEIVNAIRVIDLDNKKSLNV